MRVARVILALLLAALPTQAFAQATVLQGGSWTAGNIPQYSQSGGSQPIILNGGGAGGGAVGINPAQLGLTARGTGTPPYVGQGSGPNGEIFCLYDAPTTNATGYHSLCLSPNVSSGGLISYQAGGVASAQPLSIKINGTSYEFPFTTTGVVGPGSSVVGHAACWNNTSGTLLSDCGVFPNPGGTNGQLQYNNAGAFGGFTLGGDATVNTGTGALTITKIGGQNITLGGTLTTAGAFTTSGANALTLTTTTTTNVTMPATGTGTLATLAGSEALSNKTYNGNTWTAGTGTLTLGAGKTFTSSNTVTLTATDGSTLAIGTGGTLGTAAYTAATAYMPSGTQITNSLSADVPLNNSANYFTGPSVTQGSTGTWFCSGTITITDGGANQVYAKLWDGTTVMDSTATVIANTQSTISLSGYLASPAGNIRISARSPTGTAAVMTFNTSGNSKDSTLSCFRVQ